MSDQVLVDGRGGGTFQVDLLNGFEVRVDAARMNYPASASRLVAYLALRERPVSRAAVAGALWPETSQEKAQASLRTACWRARQSAKGIVKSSCDTLFLDQRVQTDVEALRELAQRLAGGRGPNSATWGQDALSHVGELLPDWHDDWVDCEREKYRLMALQSLEQLSSWYTRCGQFSAAAECALVAIHLDPLRESAHRALIAAELGNGNYSEVARHYKCYRRLLREELGVEPSHHMRSLLESAGLDRVVVA